MGRLSCRSFRLVGDAIICLTPVNGVAPAKTLLPRVRGARRELSLQHVRNHVVWRVAHTMSNSMSIARAPSETSYPEALSEAVSSSTLGRHGDFAAHDSREEGPSRNWATDWSQSYYSHVAQLIIMSVGLMIVMYINMHIQDASAHGPTVPKFRASDTGSARRSQQTRHEAGLGQDHRASFHDDQPEG